MDPQVPAGATGYGLALAQTLCALAIVCALAFWVLRWASRRALVGSLAGPGWRSGVGGRG